MTVTIDAHQHFWRLTNGDYRWITPDMTAIAQDFGPADLRPLLDAAGVAATVLVQAAPTNRDTDAMLAVADETPWVAAVVGWVEMTDPGAPARIEALSRHPRFRGVRPMLQDQADIAWLGSAAAARSFDALRAAGLRFDALIRPHQLGDVAALADRYPDLPIVIDHAAKPPLADGGLDAWGWAMGAAAARPNIACKLSGLLTEARPGATAARFYRLPV